MPRKHGRKRYVFLISMYYDKSINDLTKVNVKVYKSIEIIFDLILQLVYICYDKTKDITR